MFGAPPGPPGEPYGVPIGDGRPRGIGWGVAGIPIDAFGLKPDAVAGLAEEGDLSAEEAAVHLTAAPPFRPEE